MQFDPLARGLRVPRHAPEPATSTALSGTADAERRSGITERPPAPTCTRGSGRRPGGCASGRRTGSPFPWALGAVGLGARIRATARTRKHGERGDEERDEAVDDGRSSRWPRRLPRRAREAYSSRDRYVQLGEVRTARVHADGRHEDVVHERLDHGGERRADEMPTARSTHVLPRAMKVRKSFSMTGSREGSGKIDPTNARGLHRAQIATRWRVGKPSAIAGDVRRWMIAGPSRCPGKRTHRCLECRAAGRAESAQADFVHSVAANSSLLQRTHVV